jgi:hypothetical protein
MGSSRTKRSVKGQESAYDVWNNLQEVHEKKGMTSRVMLKTKLLSLKHQPFVETLSEYFLNFDIIIREIIVTALRTLPEKKQKLDMVKNHLLEDKYKRTIRGIL